jgi:hypothetical protein
VQSASGRPKLTHAFACHDVAPVARPSAASITNTYKKPTVRPTSSKTLASQIYQINMAKNAGG